MPQKQSKNTLFVTLFHPRSKGAAGKKNLQKNYFLLKFAFDFLTDLRV